MNNEKVYFSNNIKAFKKNEEDGKLYISGYANTVAKDSIIKPINNSPAVQSPKNEPLIAQNVTPTVAKQQTVVQVISENDDEVLASNEPVKKNVKSEASAKRSL